MLSRPKPQIKFADSQLLSKCGAQRAALRYSEVLKSLIAVLAVRNPESLEDSFFSGSLTVAADNDSKFFIHGVWETAK
jgi:hypothetical protein